MIIGTLFVDLELDMTPEFELELDPQPELELELDDLPEYELELESAYSVHDIRGEEYTSDYTVVPAFDEIVLETADKFLRDNVTVNPIAVSRVSNLSGGTTVYIGGNFNA